MTTLQPWKKTFHWSKTHFWLATLTYFLFISRKIRFKAVGQHAIWYGFWITYSGGNYWCPCLITDIFIGPRSDHSQPMSLTDSLTHWLTNLLKMCNICRICRLCKICKICKKILHKQMFSFSNYFLPFLLRSLSHKSKCHKDKSPMSSFKLADLFSPRIWSS